MGLCASAEASPSQPQQAKSANRQAKSNDGTLSSSPKTQSAPNQSPNISATAESEPSPVSEQQTQAGHSLDSTTLAPQWPNPELKDTPAPLVSAAFDASEVQPFSRPTTTPSADSKECIFFLSHRGPDTKESLVRPLSFILDKLGLPHFFDQSDYAMVLGQINSDQMARAAWSCRLGVVILSDRFEDSKWCLRELNTFLLRHHESPSQSLLVPVYYADHLMSKYPLYWKHFGNLSSILRKQDEAAHEFLVSLVPRLLTVPSIQSIPAVQSAQKQIAQDPFLVKRFWNQFVQGSIVENAEHKLFVDPNMPSAVDEHIIDLERIKTLHKNLIPTDIKAGLEVYQPLEYSLTPPAAIGISKEERYSLEFLSQDLLQNKITLGAAPIGDQDEKHPSLCRTTGIDRLHTTTRGDVITPQASYQVLLIQGAAGSGKSLFGWHLCSQYYNSNPSVDNFTAMPLFVSLPVFRSFLFDKSNSSQLLSAYFSKTFGFQGLKALQKQALVIILDGLDELGFKINLFKECNLHLWEKTTFLITCRSEFLQESDIAQYITPINAIDGKPAHDRLGKLYLLPFSDHQRSEYVSKFAIKYQSVYRWNAEDYLSSLKRVPDLAAFLQEPLMLFMVLSVLPELHPGVNDDKTKLCRFDPFYLDVSPVPKIAWSFPQLRRVELYALFITSWINRETARARFITPPTVTQVMDFCSQLAFEMFLRSKTSVTISQVKDSDSSLHIKPMTHLSLREQRELKKAAKTSFDDEWASKLFNEHQNEHACSPLRRSAGGQYSFLHKSLQEYLAAFHIGHQLTEYVLNDEDDGCWRKFLQSSSDTNTLLLSQKRLTSDFAVLRFAAELIDQRIRHYRAPFSHLSIESQQGFQPFGRALFDILQANRQPVASSNAISMLNVAGVPFSGRDFHGLDLASDLAFPDPFPTADLSAALLYGCNLQAANFSGVSLQNACLDRADLQHTNLTGVRFGQKPMLEGHTEVVRSIILSRDGHTLFSASDDQTIREWSVDNSIQLRCFNAEGVKTLTLSVDGQTLYASSEDGKVRSWSVTTGTVSRMFDTASSRPVNHVIVSRNHLYAASEDGSVYRWSFVTGRQLETLKVREVWQPVTCLAISLDDRILFVGKSDGNIRAWFLDDKDRLSGELKAVSSHTAAVTCLVLFFDGTKLGSGSSDCTIRLWTVLNGDLASVHVFKGHTASISSLAVSSDNRWIFSGSEDKTCRQWPVDAASSSTELKVFKSATKVTCLVLANTEDTVFAGTGETISSWLLEALANSLDAAGHTNGVNCLIHCNTFLLSGSSDTTIRKWVTDAAAEVQVFRGHADSVNCLAVLSDSSLFFSGSSDKTMRSWSIETGLEIGVFRYRQGKINALVACCPRDRQLVFSGSDDKSICGWAVEKKDQLVKTGALSLHSGAVTSLVVSLDQQTLFSSSADRTIRLWSTESGEALQVIRSHQNSVLCLALSFDGSALYSGSEDSTVCSWSTETGDVLRVMKGHFASVTCLAADGQTLYSGSSSGEILCWSALELSKPP